MIKKLAFNITFSNGTTLTGDHVLGGGMTLITGRNGTGKSLRLEMIRYALFGSDALRGKTSDYTKIEVELRWGSYAIIRNGKRAMLYKGDDELATGTGPVTKRVQELLGFDLKVFDVSCAINQGDIEALARMRPAERKRMVDEVVGMNQVDELVKFSSDQAKEFRTEAKVRKEALVEPVAPVKPVDYVEAKVLAPLVAQGDVASQEYHQLQGWLAATPAVVDDIPETVEELERLVAERREIVRRLPPRTDTTADGLAFIRAEFETARQWDEWEQRHKRQLRKHNEWVSYKAHHVTCPKCTHEWALDQVALDRLEQEVKALDPGPQPKKGFSSYTERQIEILARSVEANALWDTLPPDRSEDLKRKREALRYAEYQGKQARAEELKPLVDQLPELRAALQTAQTFERDSLNFEKDMAYHQNNKAKFEEVNKQAEEWAKAKQAMDTLRTRIKTYLLPSLNKVASHLIGQMTNQDLKSIVVDDQFEVTVDNQPLYTLSGSGKAVANLAVRIGLGQVLTKHAFPVLLADEIDAAMDDDRADATIQCLRNLGQHFEQVILISHKSPEADYIIKL